MRTDRLATYAALFAYILPQRCLGTARPIGWDISGFFVTVLGATSNPSLSGKLSTGLLSLAYVWVSSHRLWAAPPLVAAIAGVALCITALAVVLRLLRSVS